MKKVLFLVLFSILAYNSNGQTVDFTSQKKIVDPTPYNGEFTFLDTHHSEEVAKGLIGELINDYNNNQFTITDHALNNGLHQYKIENIKSERVQVIDFKSFDEYYLVKGLEHNESILNSVSWRLAIDPMRYLYEQQNQESDLSDVITYGFDGVKHKLSIEDTIRIEKLYFGKFDEPPVVNYVIELSNGAIFRLLHYYSNGLVLKCQGNDNNRFYIETVDHKPLNLKFEKYHINILDDTKGLVSSRIGKILDVFEPDDKNQDSSINDIIDTSSIKSYESPYDGSGKGIFGRKVIKRNLIDILKVRFENQENKKIVAKVCINRVGNVSNVELLSMETTAHISAGQEKQILKAIYEYKYEQSRNAPHEECGKLVIILKSIKALID